MRSLQKILIWMIDDFNRFNPGFDDVLASGGTYNLRLPNDKMNLFVANKYPILNECVQQLLRRCKC